jgi:hypothetical protein
MLIGRATKLERLGLADTDGAGLLDAEARA